jgi:hypothetical protein
MNKQELKLREGRLSKLVQDFMDNKRDIALLNSAQTILKAKIEARMVTNNSKVLFYNDEYVQKCPNPTVSINVAKFKNATNKDEFMQCIKVDVAKARKVLSEGQVEQIIDTKSGSKLVTGSIVE